MKKLLLLAALLALPIQLFAQTCPQQAANAGFTGLAFTDTFGSSSDYTTTSGSTTVSGAKWYPNFWAMPSEEGGKVTISGGVMTLSGGNICTSPTWAYSTGTATTLQGTYYHGYFEARMKFASSPTSYNSPVWPAFWLYGSNAQAPVNNGNCGECDIFEAWPASTTACTSVQTLHNWLYKWSGNTYVSDSETANTENENDMISLTAAYAGQAAPTEKAQPTDGNYHTYGCLWTKTGNGTGQVQFYYDNYLVVHENGMTAIPIGAGTNFPGQEQNAMTMILQGNNTQPISVNMVNVWTSTGTVTGTGTTTSPTTAQTVSGFPSTLSLSTSQSPYTLPATTSAGLSLTYAVASGPATVSGDTLKLTGTGTVVVNATQAGNSTYSAYSGSETITVTAPGTQTLSGFPLTLSLLTTQSPYALPATTSAGLTVTYTVVSGPATVSGDTLTLTGAGTVVVNAKQAGNSTYAAFAATETITVSGASQTIPNFPATLSLTTSQSPYTLQATTTATLTVKYTVTSGPATVSGDTLKLTGTGTVVVNGTNSGTAVYNSCNQNETITVSGLTAQTVSSFPSTLSLASTQSPYTLPTTTSAGLTLSYTVVSGPATVSGHTLTLTGAGTVVLTASQAGNTTYAPYSGSEAITVSATAQTVTGFPSALSLTMGQTPYALPATTSAGLTITYKVASGPASVSGHTLTLTGSGTVVVDATQAGNATYAAYSGAETISVSSLTQQTVNNFPATQTVTTSTPVTLTADTSAGEAITYKVTSGPATVSGDTVTFTGSGTVVISASAAGNATYAGYTGTETITVNTAATLTFAQWEALYFNSTQMANTAISGPTATPENDGVPNLLKYLYDINPSTPMSTAEYAAMPVTDVDTTTNPGTTYLTLTYRQYSKITGITVQVQTSPDLQTWTTVTPNISHQIGTDSTTGDPIIEDEVAASGSSEFIRLNVTQP